jgi:hypothetical protein
MNQKPIGELQGKAKEHKCEECEKYGHEHCECHHEDHSPKLPENKKTSDFFIGNIRQEGELYCDYRCRLYWENYLKKRYISGRSIWDSATRGEVRNMDRRNRNSKARIKKDRYNERVHKIRETQGVRTPNQVKSLNRERKKFFKEACNK